MNGINRLIQSGKEYSWCFVMDGEMMKVRPASNSSTGGRFSRTTMRIGTGMFVISRMTSRTSTIRSKIGR